LLSSTQDNKSFLILQAIKHGLKFILLQRWIP